MKSLLITFAVLLFLLTLLSSFGGSIRSSTEPFYQAMDESALMREKEILERQLNALESVETYYQAPESMPMMDSNIPPPDYMPPDYQQQEHMTGSNVDQTQIPVTETFVSQKIDLPEPYVSTDNFGYI